MWGTDLFLQGVVVGLMAAVFLYAFFGKRLNDMYYSRMLEKSKAQFIALASHYLLNPITIIQTAVSRLQTDDAKLGGDQRQGLYEAIWRGQQRLWIVTEQLILVDEIDQNSMKLNIEVANLYDVVSAAIAAIDPFARAKKLQIHLDDNTHEVQEAKFDARRMKQALIAVMDNAVKFSIDEGEIRVSLGYESGIFTVTVDDNGIGMPDEMLSHITEKFYRGSDMYTFDYEGLGLGLHISQAIVRLHQGNITFVSKPKRGTLVTVQFPGL